MKVESGVNIVRLCQLYRNNCFSDQFKFLVHIIMAIVIVKCVKHELIHLQNCNDSKKQLKNVRFFIFLLSLSQLVKMNLICFGFLVILSSSVYVKEILESQTALCLDGSPSALYVSKGDPERILIHFESGGWCGQVTLNDTLQSCYQRSKTQIGSSKNLPETLTFSSGMLSNKQPNYFINWTRIFLNYCDGAGHQGGSKNEVKYKDTSLYFRGTNITIERFDYLQKKYGLYSKTKQVVLSGASAGGLAVYFWGNYLGERIVNAKYWLIADSGIFLNSANFTSQKQDFKQSYVSLFKISNQQVDPPTPQCLQKFPGQKYMCMFADNLIEHIRYPLYIVQSLYDSWSIQYILGIDCVAKFELSSCTVNERFYIQEYHSNTSAVLQKIKSISSFNGYWANGCVYHGYTFFGSYNSAKFRIPSDSEYSIDYCIAAWMNSQQNMYTIDKEQWPSNLKCSNYINNIHLVSE